MNRLAAKNKKETGRKTRRFYEMLQKRSAQAEKKPENLIPLEKLE